MEKRKEGGKEGKREECGSGRVRGQGVGDRKKRERKEDEREKGEKKGQEER